MTIRNRTARIAPATRHAILDQLALAADEIVRLRECLSDGNDRIDAANAILLRARKVMVEYEMDTRRWWHRFVGWLS